MINGQAVEFIAPSFFCHPGLVSINDQKEMHRLTKNAMTCKIRASPTTSLVLQSGKVSFMYDGPQTATMEWDVK